MEKRYPRISYIVIPLLILNSSLAFAQAETKAPRFSFSFGRANMWSPYGDTDPDYGEVAYFIIEQHYRNMYGFAFSYADLGNESAFWCEIRYETFNSFVDSFDRIQAGKLRAQVIDINPLYVNYRTKWFSFYMGIVSFYLFTGSIEKDEGIYYVDNYTDYLVRYIEVERSLDVKIFPVGVYLRLFRYLEFGIDTELLPLREEPKIKFKTQDKNFREKMYGLYSTSGDRFPYEYWPVKFRCKITF